MAAVSPSLPELQLQKIAPVEIEMWQSSPKLPLVSRADYGK
jgi:hypothetical protein